tara:strand:- start:14 stop:730 length:717 start_codon:yes stop_codon:yes gene_type:complete
MNESAIHCARDSSEEITNTHIENALEKITLGLRTSKISSLNTKKFRAYNEVGRAIVASVNNGIESIDKITILPRAGYINGFTKIAPNEEVVTSGLISRKLLFSKIEIALAGRAAEIVVFGKSEITQCAESDLRYATSLAKEMVTKYGFSVIGPVNLDQNSDEVFLGNSLLRNKSVLADKTSKIIDDEVIKISKEALNRSIKIINKNRKLLDKLVDILIDEETIDKFKFKEITKNKLKV